MEFTYLQILDEYYLNKNNAERIEAMHKDVLKKKKLLIKDLGGEVVKVPFVDEITRKKALLRLVRLRLVNYPEAQIVVDKLLKMSNETILENKIDIDIEYASRTYQIGTKITKVLTRISGNHGYDFERTIGMFANPTTKIKEINLSVRPKDLLYAGVVGDSCYSVDGENQYLPFIIARSNYWAVAYNEDFSIRSFVLVDAERKIYGLNYTYPKQSNLIAYSVDKYFQDLGYKRMDDYSEFFRYGEFYIDATHNPYPELGKDFIVRRPEHARPVYYGIAEGTMGCAITGDPKYAQLSYMVCRSCDRIYPLDYMIGDYCEDCDDSEDRCWECDEYKWDCRCDE